MSIPGAPLFVYALADCCHPPFLKDYTQEERGEGEEGVGEKAAGRETICAQQSLNSYYLDLYKKGLLNLGLHNPQNNKSRLYFVALLLSAM